jgi:hypothetical protein
MTRFPQIGNSVSKFPNELLLRGTRRFGIVQPITHIDNRGTLSEPFRIVGL